MKKASKGADQTVAKEVAKWSDRMSIAENNQTPMFEKFAEWFDDFYAIIDGKKYAIWRSKIYFPRLNAKVWQIIPKLVMQKPDARVTVKGEDPNIEGAKKIEELLDFQYDNPEFDEPMFKKLTDVMIDAVVTGKGIAMVPWTTKSKVSKQQATDRYQDPMTGEDISYLKLGEEVVRSTITAYPDFIPVNIFNFFYSPAGTTLQKKHWLIVKDWKTLDELKNANQDVEFYKNLDSLKEAAGSTDDSSAYNASRNRLVGEKSPNTADSTVRQYEIWHCFDKEDNTITTIVPDARTIIRKIRNPYWHGKYPFVDFEVKPRAHDFWGEGIFEVNQRLQNAINSLYNHYFDNLNLSLDGMVKVPEGTRILDYTIKPGGMFRYAGQEPQQWKFPEPNPAQIKMADELLTRALDDTTIQPYAAGVPNSVSDNTQGTKGGIMALQAAADDILSYMRKCFTIGLRQVFTLWSEMDKQFIDRITYIDTVEDGVRKASPINPADIQGEFTIVVDQDQSADITDPQADQQKKQAMVDRILQLKGAADAQEGQKAQGLPQGVLLNFEKIIKETIEDGGASEAKDYLVEQEEPEMGEMPQPMGMPMGPQEQPMQPPMPEMPPKPGIMDRIRGMFGGNR